jgi:hypothetical protein
VKGCWEACDKPGKLSKFFESQNLEFPFGPEKDEWAQYPKPLIRQLTDAQKNEVQGIMKREVGELVEIRDQDDCSFIVCGAEEKDKGALFVQRLNEFLCQEYPPYWQDTLN